jgi:hypothetical protein
VRFAFIVHPDHYDPVKGYHLMIVYQGMKGLWPTLLHWGHDYDLALEHSFEWNDRLGVSAEETLRLLILADVKFMEVH